MEPDGQAHRRIQIPDGCNLSCQSIDWTHVGRSSKSIHLHQPVNAGGNGCTFSGAGSANPNFTQWLALVTSDNGLPANAATVPVQVVVTKDIPQAGNTQVQVTLCWRMPQDNVWRRHQVVANINPVN
jgi:hypothetical protein